MKKSLFALLFAALGIFSVSCQQEMEFVEEETISSVTFTAVAEDQPDTKATLDNTENPATFLWQTDDAIRACVTKDTQKSYKGHLISGENSNFATFGNFSISIVGTTLNYALFPYDYSGQSSVSFPAEIDGYVSGSLFTPMIAVPAEPFLVEASAEYNNLYFNHAGGALKFTVKAMPIGVNSVVFTANENIAGTYNINTATVSAATVKSGDWTSGSPSNTSKTITYTFPVLNTVQDMVFYVPVPADVELTTSLSVEVIATTGSVQTFTKTFKESTSYTVKRAVVGNIGEFTVTNPVPVPTVKYDLLTDVSQLADGDFIVIAANTGKDVAMAKTYESSYRNKVDITRTAEYINITDDIQIITLESGTASGTFAFNVGGTYLTSASEKNLKNEKTISAAGSWKITLGENSVATVTPGEGKSTWSLKYNSGSPRFTTYKSGQTDLLIYYKKDTRTALDAPTGLTAVADASSVLLEWNHVLNAESYDVYVDGELVTATIDATGAVVSATVSGLVPKQNYSITVVAKPAEASEDYKKSEPSEALSITTEEPDSVEPVTIEAFLAKEDSEVVWYQLTGVVSEKEVRDYGINLTLTDGTGSVYVYAVLGAEDVNNGDSITIIGNRYTYASGESYEKDEVTNSYVVSHIPAPVLNISKTSLSFEAEGGSDTFTVELLNSDEVIAVAWEGGAETHFAVSGPDASGVVTVTAPATEDAKSAVLVVSAVGLEKKINVTQAGKAGVAKGDSWSYTFESATKWTSDDVTLNNLLWTKSQESEYSAWDGNNQRWNFGKNKLAGETTISTNAYIGGVECITVTGACNSSQEVDVTVSVGDVKFSAATSQFAGSEKVLLTFKNETLVSGTIKILFKPKNTTSNANYGISEISINPAN